jgi:hypothetical protein
VHCCAIASHLDRRIAARRQLAVAAYSGPPPPPAAPHRSPRLHELLADLAASTDAGEAARWRAARALATLAYACPAAAWCIALNGARPGSDAAAPAADDDDAGQASPRRSPRPRCDLLQPPRVAAPEDGGSIRTAARGASAPPSSGRREPNRLAVRHPRTPALGSRTAPHRATQRRHPSARMRRGAGLVGEKA